MGTGDVSPSVPDTVTHALADVLAALVFLEGNIMTRYGSSARQTEKTLGVTWQAAAHRTICENKQN
jgi:hypothetical protein